MKFFFGGVFGTLKDCRILGGVCLHGILDSEKLRQTGIGGTTELVGNNGCVEVKVPSLQLIASELT